MDPPRRVKSSKVMKGRPITLEEFERMLAKTRKVVPLGPECWEYYLTGMWLSGLRLEESLDLWWDREDRISVEVGGEYPMFRVHAEQEKGFKDRLLAMAPEFAEVLLKTPSECRKGPMFTFLNRHGQKVQFGKTYVGKVVSKIGKAAGVIVDTDLKNGKVKHATTHDLRRSLGERWCHFVMPHDLIQLMRHNDINTTNHYYVGRNAQNTDRVLWDVYNPTTSPNISTNTSHSIPVFMGK